MTYNILIAKADKTISVDFDAMPENAKRFLIEYGLRQKLNDAGSSATVKELGKEEAGNQAFAMAEASLAALMQGDVSVRRSASGKTLEERVFTRVLKAVFKAITKQNISELSDDSDEALLEALVEATGKSLADVTAAIEKRVDAELAIEKQKAAIPSIEL